MRIRPRRLKALADLECGRGAAAIRRSHSVAVAATATARPLLLQLAKCLHQMNLLLEPLKSGSLVGHCSLSVCRGSTEITLQLLEAGHKVMGGFGWVLDRHLEIGP